MDLLFLTFGPNIKNHYQANFAILSFLSHANAVNSINVYTDHPEFYTRFKDQITLVPVNKVLLTDWEGPHKFFWRVKIKAIEDLILNHGRKQIVYLDSDTFLYKDPKQFLENLAAGKAMMHENEGKLSELKSKTERTMWDQVKNKSFGGITIGEAHAMWNAGVVAIPEKQNLQTIQLALAICDAMCAANVTRRLIEQFSISVALHENYGLQPASPWIGHYWGNKNGWNESISAFFLESCLKNYSVTQDLERIKTFDFNSIPIRKKVKNTKLRLQKMLQKLFPDKQEMFLQK